MLSIKLNREIFIFLVFVDLSIYSYLSTSSHFVSGQCANERSDMSCEAWASQGHCDKSPELMQQYCRKTCGLCGDEPVVPTTISSVTNERSDEPATIKTGTLSCMLISIKAIENIRKQ